MNLLSQGDNVISDIMERHNDKQERLRPFGGNRRRSESGAVRAKQ